MKEFDFGYFGSGDEGYAQYMTAFERSFGGADTDLDADSDFSDSDTDDSEDF